MLRNAEQEARSWPKAGVPEITSPVPASGLLPFFVTVPLKTLSAAQLSRCCERLLREERGLVAADWGI